MSDGKFVHLHVHSHYSLLDGLARENELAETAAEMGMGALALTDHGNMFAAVEFYKAAKNAGVKPIIGFEAYVAPKSRFDKKAIQGKPYAFHITLLAENEAGYRNLCKLSSKAYIEGFYYKPRIDKEILAEHSKGIIALSGCLASELSYYLLNKDEKAAEELASFYREAMGADNFFLELQDNGIPEQKTVLERTVELGARLGISSVATNDVHYINRSDAEAQDVLLCINTKSTLTDQKRLKFSTDEFYFKSPDEMTALFGKYDGAVENSIEIAGRCNFDFKFGEYHIPVFTPPDGREPSAYLRGLCEIGMQKRYGDKWRTKPDLSERLEYELSVINEMGFVSYFLVVWDFIRFAREKEIPVGPGRGSAAGSIVAYTLGITDVDPLKYALFFERFLNPSRISMPDIDIDFCQDRRGEVIEYVRAKYGAENVAQIITYSTLKAKGAIRDVARVLDIPLGEADRIAKMIPDGPDVTLQTALEKDPDLRALRDSKPEYKNLFRLVERIQGKNRQSGVHAAGVVITDKPLMEYVPLAREGDDITTQFEMTTIEEIGLLKMDFLGLKNLTLIKRALDGIEESVGKRLDLDKISLDDEKTYELLSRGESDGVFQLESSGMRGLLKAMKPDKFEDLIAVIALYRPGPLGSGMHQMYVRRKHGEEDVTYPYPSLKGILEETYGVIVYQEQVMQIANVLSGFTLAEADKLRKAMGKKMPEILEQYREKFINGAVERGVQRDVASEIFSNIEHFAEYGFNKSHSTAYAIIAYQTAYLKAHYPVQFMAALLTCDMGNSDKVKQYCDELKALGIRLVPPDINRSMWHFTVEDGAILYGLGAVKGVGQAAAQAIVDARKSGCGFTGLHDFACRIDLRQLNKGVIEALIKAGALDSLGARRAQLADALPEALEMASEEQKLKRSGQCSLFEMTGAPAVKDSARLPDVPEWPDQMKLAYEKEHLGFWLSSHPLERHRRLLETYSTARAAELADLPDGSYVVLGGMITSVRQHFTKHGKPMAFLTAEDLHGAFDVVVFNDLYEKSKEHLKEDSVVFLAGAVDTKRQPPSLKADEIIPAEEVRDRLSDAVIVVLDLSKTNDGTIGGLKDAVKFSPGLCPLVLKALEQENGGISLRAGKDYRVRVTDEFIERTLSITGVSAVHVIPRKVLPRQRENGWRRRATNPP
jgi:DNA polymerase-3 subunit alpha